MIKLYAVRKFVDYYMYIVQDYLLRPKTDHSQLQCALLPRAGTWVTNGCVPVP